MTKVDLHSPEMGGNQCGVLLLAHGAPERAQDVPEFLLNVRGGRKLPDAAVEEIVRRYQAIGGGSPLLKLTNQQASGLEKVLNAGGDLRCPVYVGMRNWKPFITEAVNRIAEDRVKRLIAVCLAPQNSRTSVGLYKKYLAEAIEKSALRLEVDFVESWHNHPLLIKAFEEKISAALRRAEAGAGENVPVIFTAHSVPASTIQSGDPYENQVRETVSLVAGALGLEHFRVAFQSQGMTPEPWIGPTVESQIDEIAAQGSRHALIAPVGFVCDHVEILYDIDVVFRDYGKRKGVTVHRSESLNDSPILSEALASIVNARLNVSHRKGLATV